MSMLRKIAVTGLVSLTLAIGSVATVTPALAHGGHGGGGHGGGEHAERMGMGHFGGGEHRGGAFYGHDRFRQDRFGHDHFAGRFRDRGPVFFGSNDDYDRCQWQWLATSDGDRVWGEACY